MPRNTASGKFYEDTVERAIRQSCLANNLSAKSQQTIGTSPSGRKHRVDWELISNGDPNIRGLVSCKVQITGGTAEEKVPFEVIKLIHAMDTDTRYKRAWIVLGGKGFTPGLKEFYQLRLHEVIPKMKDRVFIIADTDTLISTNLSLA